ncbi:cytochrome c4 [Cardiobacterium sp. AH-315-I02]|nr:cytochrome c4 [Cardiobacterium sp. AH-315-I02]
MKKIILAGIALFFVTSGAVFANATFSDAVEAGKAKSALCAGCHGMDGNSLIPMNPKLAGQNQAYMVKQIKDFKANTTRQNAIMIGMVAALSDEDAADIGAYYQAQAVSQVATFDEEKAAAGSDMYKGGDMTKGIPACQSCHGPMGGGVAGIGYPQVGGQFVEYTLAQLKAFKGGTRSNDDKELMRSIMVKMSDEEMEAVSHYIASLVK